MASGQRCAGAGGGLRFPNHGQEQGSEQGEVGHIDHHLLLPAEYISSSGLYKHYYPRAYLSLGGLATIPAKIGHGIPRSVLLSGCSALEHTVLTVVCLVCKSYHRENIDKSA